MYKKAIDQDLIIVLTSTLITLAIWIGFEVYRAYTKVSPPLGVEKHLDQLRPTLNTAVLDILEQRGQ